MSVLRHWLVRNINGAVVTACETEAKANGIRDAYPDAGITVEGPFVPEAASAGAVSELERMERARDLLADMAERLIRERDDALAEIEQMRAVLAAERGQ